MEAAVTAPSIEVRAAGYSACLSTASVGLKLVRTYLAMDPQDVNGFGQAQLARALAFSGRHSEAATSATAAYRINNPWAEDPLFCYRYAKLMSLTNQMNLATIGSSSI